MIGNRVFDKLSDLSANFQSSCDMSHNSRPCVGVRVIRTLKNTSQTCQISQLWWSSG